MAIGVFEFLLGAVIVGGVSSVLASKHNLERERIKARGAAAAGETENMHGVVGDLHQDVARLKERVQVLEKPSRPRNPRFVPPPPDANAGAR